MIAMSDATSILVDTNILVYAADPLAGAKHLRARAIVADLMRQGRLVLSTQSLNEFYNASTRPHKPPSLTHEDAARIVADLAASCRIIPLTAAVTLRALTAIPLHGFSFWDALIWSAAREGGISTLYTEDFQHGREIEGVRIVDPFAVAS